MLLLLLYSSGSATVTLAPPSGAVAVSGLAPALRAALAPPSGAVATSGLAPALRAALAPPSGAVATSGLAPALIFAATRSIEPGAGALTTAGVAPALIVRFVAIRVGWPRGVDASERISSSVLRPMSRAAVLDSSGAVVVHVPSG